MKATIDSWRLWGKEQEYPVLILEASKEEVKETEALLRLAEITKGLRGLGYKQSLAAVNNPDTKGQKTSFVIDLGTLLTLCSELSLDKAKKIFATAWLGSIVKSLKSREPEKVSEDLLCRCGQTFKTLKIKKKHLKKCSVIARDMKLLRRVKDSLDAGKGKKKADGNKKNKSSKLDNPKSPEIRRKVSSKVSKETKNKNSRTTRRTKA